MIPKNEAISPVESVRRLQSVMKEECRLWGEAFFITKLPRLYKHIPILVVAYPEAKFVHIIRDGRAVSLSNRQKFMRNQESGIEGLYASAGHWVEVMKEINLQGRNLNILEIKYEDFCSDVHDWIGRFLGYVGLPGERFPFHRCPGKLESTNSRWLHHSTEKELVLMEEMQGE